MKKKTKPQWPDLDVSDECQRLAGIYVLSESALELIDKLQYRTDYKSPQEVNEDIAKVEDLIKRIKKHAYDDKHDDFKVGGST